MIAVILLTLVTYFFTYTTYKIWGFLIQAVTDHTENASVLEVISALIMLVLIGGSSIILTFCLSQLIFTLI